MKSFTQSNVHFVGIGGIGMSGIAEILVSLGANVSGSDLGESERTKRLKSLGINVFLGHHESNLSDADVVVFSSAVDRSNPEIKEALKKEIPVISRAEALAELMSAKRGVAIAGTHGKTTTTSMVAQVFESGGKNPTVVSGGVLLRLGTNAKLGSGEWFVAEADESDGSFEKLSPEISVITNIDNDHVEHYGSFDDLVESFKSFADRVPFYGTVIYNGDDRDCRAVVSTFKKKSISFGFSEDNDFYLKPISGDSYHVFHGEEVLGQVNLPVHGIYNAFNSLAAIVVGLRAGLEFSQVKEGIEAFSGVKRRFEIRADSEELDMIVVDDYAHHPTEVMAVLSTCKKRFLGRRVRCIFQPHRFTRLKACWDQFKNAFDMADEIKVLPVYPAGEDPIEGFDSESLCDVLIHDKVEFFGEGYDALLNNVMESRKPGDLIITLGAGDISQFADMVSDKVNYGN